MIGWLRLFAVVLAGLPTVLSAKVFFNTTDPIDRSDDEIRHDNIVLPRMIDSLVQLDKTEQFEEKRGSFDAPDTSRIDPTVALILRPERELLLQQLGVLRAFEERGRRPAAIAASGWGGWLAALWISGWSVEAIEAMIREDGLLNGEVKPPAPHHPRLGIWWNRDLSSLVTPSAPSDEIPPFGKGASREAELRKQALLRLRLMISPEATAQWTGDLALLVARVDTVSRPVSLPDSILLSDGVALTMRDPLRDAAHLWADHLWSGVHGELEPWLSQGALFPGRERWFIPAPVKREPTGGEEWRNGVAFREARLYLESEAYANVTPTRGLLQLRIAKGETDLESGRKATLELIDEQLRRSGADEAIPRDTLRRRSAEEALGQEIRVELDSIDAPLQSFFYGQILKGSDRLTPTELRSRLDRAMLSGVVLRPHYSFGDSLHPRTVQLFATPGVPIELGIGPYAIWPAGTGLWGSGEISWVQQTLYTARIEGWWGEWAKGASGQFALRSGILSGFEGSLQVMRNWLDHSAWDNGSAAVLKEREEWVEFRVIHGARRPIELTVRFDHSSFWTSLSQESRDFVELLDLWDTVLVQQGEAAQVRPISLVVDNDWRVRKGIELGLEWSDKANERFPWALNLGLESFGVEGWYSSLAPLFLRTSVWSAHRVDLRKQLSIGVEGAAGIDLAMTRLLDGELRLPEELWHGYSHGDPALDLATSQAMGAGLLTPFRLSDDRARGFARLGTDLRQRWRAVELHLGGGLVYRHLPRSFDAERELQKVLTAEVIGKWGALQWRGGVENRSRVGEKSDGHLTWNGPTRSDFRWLIQLSTAPF